MASQKVLMCSLEDKVNDFMQELKNGIIYTGQIKFIPCKTHKGQFKIVHCETRTLKQQRFQQS